MIIQFLMLKLQEMDVNGMWFQQDCATCHTVWETNQSMRWIFFFNSTVYVNKTMATHGLKEEVERYKIQSYLFKTVLESFKKKMCVR